MKNIWPYLSVHDNDWKIKAELLAKRKEWFQIDDLNQAADCTFVLELVRQNDYHTHGFTIAKGRAELGPKAKKKP
jgi:hypothetical protein